MIGFLKHVRRLATRHDKTAGSFLSVAHLAAIHRWMSLVHATYWMALQHAWWGLAGLVKRRWRATPQGGWNWR